MAVLLFTRNSQDALSIHAREDSQRCQNFQTWPPGKYNLCTVPSYEVFQPSPSTTKYKQGCMELTGFMDSPWSGSSFTFPSKSLVSKFTILYLILFRLLLLSQDLMKINHQISVLSNNVPNHSHVSLLSKTLIQEKA